MRVIGVVTAVNENPRYVECVQIFNDNWAKINSISNDRWIPIVVYVTSTSINLRFEDKAYTWEISPEKLQTASISQLIRIFIPKYLPVDYVITSDVDMIPMSLKVFETAIFEIESRGFDFVVCRDVLKDGQYPICYALASPSVWGQVISGNPQNELEKIEKVTDEKYDFRRGKKDWYLDQRYLFESLTIAEGKGLILRRLSDSETLHSRLEPTKRNLLMWPVVGLRVLLGKFTDYHLHMPIHEHRIFVTFILTLQALHLKLTR